MSQHILTTESDGQPVTVFLGYDRPLNYVFCAVMDNNGDVLYSNLEDKDAGTEQQSVNYYRPFLEDLGITVPDEIFRQVALDQLRRVGNRTVE